MVMGNYGHFVLASIIVIVRKLFNVTFIFSETTGPVRTKPGSTVHRMVVYKMCFFTEIH